MKYKTSIAMASALTGVPQEKLWFDVCTTLSNELVGRLLELGIEMTPKQKLHAAAIIRAGVIVMASDIAGDAVKGYDVSGATFDALMSVKA